jgi:integrase
MAAERAPRGGGSIRPVPGRKHVFRIRWMDGTKQREKTFRGSRAAANEERNKLVVLGGGKSEEVERATEGRTIEGLMAEWTNWQEEQGKALRTVEQNRDAARLRIVPAIGNVRLSELTTKHVDDMLGQWNRDGLKTSTIRRYFAPLRTALSQAVRWGWIDTNPAASATMPRGEPSPVRPTPPAAVMAELIETARSREDYVMAAALWLDFGAGMRRGEVAALRWSDVDLVAGTINVTGNMDRHGRIGPTKTHRQRTVRIDPGTVEMLRDLHEVTGDGPTVLGIKNPDILTDRVRRLCKLTGYVDADDKPLYSFHGGRHAHATELLGRGASLANVSARLGHANPRTTIGVYAHALASGDEELAETIGQIMGDA